MQNALIKQEAKDHLNALDSLRGIAILLVLFYHAQIEVYPGYKLKSSDYDGFFVSSEVPFYKLIWNVIPTSFGASGVELFLLISGYLIHRSAILNKDYFSVSVFYIKRVARIVPPYIISMMVLIPILEWSSLSDWIRHVFMIHNLFESSFFALNPSYWSLALEMQLYVVYPFVLYCTVRFGSNKVLSFLLLLSIASSIYSFLYYPHSLVWDKVITKFWVFWYLGAFIAEKHLADVSLFRRHRTIMIGLLCITILLRMTILFSPLKFYLYTLFHLVLLDWVIMAKKGSSSGMFAKYLNYVGVVSYSLYLYHQPVMRWLIGTARSYNDYWLITLAVIGSFMVIHLISHISYKYVELPSISYGKSVARLSGSK